MQSLKFDDVVPLLLNAEPRGNGFDASCPVHGDDGRSLSVDRAANGDAQLFCVEGCRHDDIVAAFRVFQKGATPVPEVDLVEQELPSSESNPAIGVGEELVAEAASEVVLSPTGLPRDEPSGDSAPNPCSEPERMFPAEDTPPPGRFGGHAPGGEPSAEAVEAGRALIAGIVKGDAESISAVSNLGPDVFHTDAERAIVRALHVLLDRGVEKPEPTDLLSAIEPSVCSPSEFAAFAEVAVSCNPMTRAQKLREDFEERKWRRTASQLALRLPDLAPADAVDQVTRAAAGSKVTSRDWPEPTPLPDGLLTVEHFVPELLPDVIRGAVVDISQRMQCPPDFTAVSAVVALGSLIGRQVLIRPKQLDKWSVAPNLWGMVVSPPGVMKTPSMREVLRHLGHLEDREREDFEVREITYKQNQRIEREKEKYENQQILKQIKNGVESAAILDTLRSERADSPVRRRFIVNDSTVEKLGEILSASPNGVLVFRDELTGLLYSLEKEGQEGARAFYLEAWDGNGSFTYDRIGRGTVEIKSACVSILGTIQPTPLQRYFRSAARTADDGLLQRFQISVYPDINSEWTYVDRKPDADATASIREVFLRLANIDIEAIGADVENGQAYLHFAPDAQVEFNSWLSELERRLRSTEEHPAFVSHLAKYRSLVPSLALIFHLADHGVGPVSVAAVQMACAWAEYLESHARRIYVAGLSADVDAAKGLLVHIKRGDLPGTFSARHVYRHGWSGLGTPSEVDNALRVLVDHGFLRERRIDTGGRPTLEYTVHPKIRRRRDG